MPARDLLPQREEIKNGSGMGDVNLPWIVMKVEQMSPDGDKGHIAASHSNTCDSL
jgi:hypothetical protein